MAYTVNKTNGAILASVTDGTIDTSTDITLIGKNYPNWGEFFNENMVALLEHFANSTAPSSPIAGQLWWDTSNSLMKVYTGSTFKTISSSTSSATAPTSNVTGDLWWDTTNNQLKVYNGSTFTLIGPAFTSGSGQSGAIVDTVTDSVGGDHVVVKMFVSDTIVAIVSKDAVFTPQVAISGFATIKPGYNLNSTISSVLYNGTATNAEQLNGVAAANYLRSDSNDSTSGTLAIANDTGLTIGADSDLKLAVSGSDAIIQQLTTDGDIIVSVTDGGVLTEALRIDGATTAVTVALTTPTLSNGVATKNYVDAQVSGSGALLTAGGTMTGDILASGTVDIGSSGTPFTTIYATTFSGTATTAQYADLAEIYSADQNYEPGTVVRICEHGDHEVEATTEDLDQKVFGIVSENPAYLMNSDADGVAVALAGRVRVKITGNVQKGDRLVASAMAGYARAASLDEITFANVIGRALSDSDNDTVECVVGKN